jgi:hypothetical protein
MLPVTYVCSLWFCVLLFISLCSSPVCRLCVSLCLFGAMCFSLNVCLIRVHISVFRLRASVYVHVCTSISVFLLPVFLCLQCMPLLLCFSVSLFVCCLCVSVIRAYHCLCVAYVSLSFVHITACVLPMCLCHSCISLPVCCLCVSVIRAYHCLCVARVSVSYVRVSVPAFRVSVPVYPLCEVFVSLNCFCVPLCLCFALCRPCFSLSHLYITFCCFLYIILKIPDRPVPSNINTGTWPSK